MNKMRFGFALILIYLSFILPLKAQGHVHVHDTGDLLVMSQGKLWNVEFIMPAINAFGFEHKPQTNQHKKVIQGFIDKVAKLENVLVVDKSCKLVSFEQQMSQLLLEDTATDGHIDVNFSYLLSCKTAPKAFDIKLFSWLKGLEQISAKWVTSNGQGAKALSAKAPRLVIDH